jgi:hypothetical protein
VVAYPVGYRQALIPAINLSDEFALLHFQVQ